MTDSTQMKVIVGFLIVAAIVASAYRFNYAQNPGSILPAKAQANILPLSADITAPAGLHLVDPIADFKQRIIKKDFGIYITPATSPVQPDHFTGFHTGVDVEYGDVATDVPVYAIADGTIVFRNWANGYGGVIVIKHIINGVPLFALYGHLDPASFPPSDVTQVTAGRKIGILGDGLSHETDGARKHLHFSLYTGQTFDLRGYVPTQEDLKPWLNPLDFYN